MTIQTIMKLIEEEPSEEIWKEAINIAESIEANPDEVFAITEKALSKTKHGDTITALSTCIIEHILEHDFSYFDRIESEINRGNGRMIYALAMCRKFGQAKREENSRRWDAILAANKRRLRRALRHYPGVVSPAAAGARGWSIPK
jgi:hypothetical protein